MPIHTNTNPDALPQLIGEYRPVDEWQAHINALFYGLHGGQVRSFYQTFAAADYRLGHALAADYYERVRKRRAHPGQLIIHEWGCGNGNLAACFLSHLRALDTEQVVYPRVHYLLVDAQESMLAAARSHPDLAAHRDRIGWLLDDASELSGVKDGTVDRIIACELWNDLPTKLMLRRQGDIEEEYIRPNLSEKKHDAIENWSAFVRAFDARDIDTLKSFGPFLDSIIWEREYRKAEWTATSYRKTVTAFLKQIDEQVLVPINTGAARTLAEAKRLLAPDAVGFSAFDAGTAELKLLNDPDKPCYSQVGGQFSFIIDFPLLQSVAQHEGLRTEIESQQKFIGQALGANVVTLMDLLATHPSAGRLGRWEQDRLILKTVHVVNERYESPYERRLDFPLLPETPSVEREALEKIITAWPARGVPDTVAYLTEEEILGVLPGLESLGYERETIEMAMNAPSQSVDYFHLRVTGNLLSTT